MKKSIGNIYLAWRNGIGHNRHVVGILKRNSNDGLTFEYIKSGVKEAEKEGFQPYTEFPNVDGVYTKNILEIFSQRLIKEERNDSNNFYSFWEIDSSEINDDYSMLAKTMGLVPTDNFEFLAEYYPIKGVHFITDIAGLSHSKLDANAVYIDEQLSIKIDKLNSHDKSAVKVFNSDGLEIGYIKKIHNRVFHNRHSEKLKLTVKAIDKNGKIRKIFVRVSNLD